LTSGRIRVPRAAFEAWLQSQSIAALAATTTYVDSGDGHRSLIRGNRWAAIWELDALEAIGLVRIEGPSREDEPASHRTYHLTDDYLKLCESVGRPHTFPLHIGEEGAIPARATDAFAHPGSEAATNGHAIPPTACPVAGLAPTPDAAREVVG
jgi:hypothetical protein